MRLLVTGASGFIGGYLCRHLSSSNEVIGILRASGNDRLILPEAKNLRFHTADLAEGLDLPDDIDIVIHSAARMPGQNLTTRDFVFNNIIATQNLI